MEDDVLGVLLPCHSIGQDAAFARLVAQRFDIRTLTVDLGSVFDEFLKVLPAGITAMAQANIKPRLRMAACYSLAQTNNYLVAGTGNKSELLVGYFTKYGDGGVDVEPLGGLYKGQVRQLARDLDVPVEIIDRPPTAGLWPGQTDEGELGITYDALDETLAAMELGCTQGIEPALLNRVRAMVASSAHKRAMPPVFSPGGQSA